MGRVRFAVVRNRLRDTVILVTKLNVTGKQMFSFDATALVTNALIIELLDHLFEFNLENNIYIGVRVERLKQLHFLCKKFKFNSMGKPIVRNVKE